MKIGNLKAVNVVGRWIYYRRAYGWHNAELRRAYVQEVAAGGIVGLVTETCVTGRAVYPRRSERNPCPLLLPVDELEIHEIVEPSADAAEGAPSA